MLELYLASTCEIAVAPKAPANRTTATAASAHTCASVIRSAVLQALASAQVAPYHLGVTLALHIAGTGVLPAESDIIQIGYQGLPDSDNRTRAQQLEGVLASAVAAETSAQGTLPSVVRAGFGEHPMLKPAEAPAPPAPHSKHMLPLMHGHTRLCVSQDPLRALAPKLLLQLDWMIDSDARIPAPFLETQEWRDLPRQVTLAVQVALRYSLLRLRQHRSDLLLRLAPPQRPVLPLLAEGLSQRQIADRLGRSLHTVHDHVKGAYAALGISARHQLFVLWNGGNLSDLGDIE